MQARERRVRQELDSASSRPASRPSPHSSASARRPLPGRLLVVERRQRRLAIHRRDVPVEPQRVRLGGEAALLERASRLPYCASSDAAVFAPTPRAPGILSDGSPRSAMKSGTCVGLDAVALAHLGRPDPRERPAALLRLQHDRPLADELERVAVAARDERVAAAGLLERDGGGEEVVGLVARRLRGGEAHRLDELRRQVELLEQLLVELTRPAW